MIRAAALAAVIALPGAALAEPRPGAQTVERFEAVDPWLMNAEYLLHLPEGDGPHPVMMFLHGTGERGADIGAVKTNGPPMLVEQGMDLPFIIISPQLPEHGHWDRAAVLALLDHVMDEVLPASADRSRVYLTGLSRGGRGTWRIAGLAPDRFAAIAPIAAPGDAMNACQLRDTPVWSFHGDQDDVAPVQGNIDMVEAVRACGGAAELTIYPGVGHGSWVPAYEDPALYDWLLDHSLPQDE